MDIKDEIAKRSLELFRKEVAEGAEYTKSWLNLDAEAFRAHKNGIVATLPPPFCDDPVDHTMMADVQGKNVLCLAGGGGQHSAVFSLLGANVTVLDLTPEQLDADQVAAKHYGYEVKTIQGDMRDLSMFPNAHFDRVYQPISTLYVPNLREIYSGVARVLKADGLYYSQYAVPLLYMAEYKGWDGKGYLLRITEPYMRGEILENQEGKFSFSEGKPISEFHHLLSDIINGLIAEGLNVCGLWESPRPSSEPPAKNLNPESEAHIDRYLPYGLSVLAKPK